MKGRKRGDPSGRVKKDRYPIVLFDGTSPGDESVARLERPLLSSLLPAYHIRVTDVHVMRRFVRSRGALAKQLALIRHNRRVPTRGLHFVGHGKAGSKGTWLQLGSEDRVNLRDEEDLALFANLDVDWILLSCCDVGGHRQDLEGLLKISRAGAVFALEGGVEDFQAFMLDVMFYHLLLVPPQSGILKESQMKWPFIRKRLQIAADCLFVGTRVKVVCQA